MKSRYVWILAWAAVAALAPAADAAEKATPLATRRAALVALAAKGPAGIPQIAAALKDDNLVIRRTAVRLLADLGKPARPALAEALSNSDFLVRRTALTALCEPLTAECLPHLEKSIQDESLAVRLVAVNLLASLEPRSDAVNKILDKARSDESTAIRDVAARALWPFHRDTVLLRDRKDWDHEVVVTQSIPLPKTGWRFQRDPERDGHLKKWFAPDLDDSKWPAIEIERSWESQGHEYDGVAWYRGSFELPAKPDHNAVELHFDAVDECAWVWVNGIYVGQHDLGTAGWDRPFAIDITREVRWGQKNQVTIRVYDSAYAGGIWKPVRIDILK